MISVHTGCASIMCREIPLPTPSRVRIVYRNRGCVPQEYLEKKHRRIAVEDALLRRLHKNLRACADRGKKRLRQKRACNCMPRRSGNPRTDCDACGRAGDRSQNRGRISRLLAARSRQEHWRRYCLKYFLLSQRGLFLPHFRKCRE